MLQWKLTCSHHSLSLLIQYEIKLRCKPIICLLRKHYAVVDDDEVKLLKIDYLFMQIFINMSFECLSDDDNDNENFLDGSANHLSSLFSDGISEKSKE